MGNEGLSWLDRWRMYRDRLIASPRVQRWALANPLTRPVAQRRARAILDLCADRLLTGPLHLREAAPLQHPVQGTPDHCGTCREAVAFARSNVPPPRRCGFTWAGGAAGRSIYGLGQLGAALAGNPAALSLIEHQPAVRRSRGSGRAASRFPPRCGHCSLLALLGGRASNGVDGRGCRALQRAHGRIAASHCAGSA